MAKPRVVKIEMSPTVRAVLERGMFDGDRFHLPPEQLDRDVYIEVDKFLKAAGGKWNRSVRAHLFPGDARALLLPAIEVGEVVDKKRSNEAFYTPDDVADHMMTLLRPTDGYLLEPSAGDGALCRAVQRWSGNDCFITAVELEPNEELKYHAEYVMWGDFRESFSPGERTSGEKKTIAPQDYVAMNPPFRVAAEHTLWAFEFLRPGGRLASIVPSNILTKAGKQERAFQAAHELCHLRTEDLEPGTFKASGTMVGAKMVMWRKP
jgi:hypothetical protein